MGNTERVSLWIAMVTLALSIITSMVQISMSLGRMDQRIITLEKNEPSSVRREEWTQFTQDMRDRLDRIERKVDHDSK